MNWLYIILILLLHVLIFEWHTTLAAAPISSNHLFKRTNNKSGGFVVANPKTGKVEPLKSSFTQKIRNTGRQIASKIKIALARPTKADRAEVHRPRPQQQSRPGLSLSESHKEILRKQGWEVRG